MATEVLKINIWDYFEVIFIFSYYREDAVNGLVEARWKMKVLVSCVHLVAKAFNFEVSRFDLADYVIELY